MDYTALYRKYRPRRFEDLVGQQHIAKTLLNAITQGKVAHAYLFCGPRGTGKTSAAQIMSRAVNCLASVGGEPCGECAACKRIVAGGSLDILEIDAASNRGIDEMRDLRERVKYTPVQEKYKVYIIDEVHMLTTEAFNALLKTLEEPPVHVIFILATTEPHKVPVTVLSRCQRFDFHRVGQGDIIQHLQKLVELEGVSAADDALALIARRAEGGLRDAISLLDQCIVAVDAGSEITVKTISAVLGIVDEVFVAKLAKSIAENDALAVVTAVEVLAAEGRDLRQFLQQLLEYVREQLLVGITKKQGAIPGKRALQMLRDLVDGDQRLRNSLTPRLTLEIALLTAARLENQFETAPKPSGMASGPQVQAQTQANREIPPANPKVFADSSMSITRQSLVKSEVSAKVWQEILKQVGKASVVANAYLKMAVPLKVDGKILWLGFSPDNKIHKNGIEKPDNKEKIEKAVSNVFGTLMEIKTRDI